MLKNEPVGLAGVLATVLIVVLHAFDVTWLDGHAPEIASLVVGVIATWWARRQVTPVEKVRQAGLTPSELDARAESPQFPYAEGE